MSNTRNRVLPSAAFIIADDESLIRLDLREMLIHLGYDVIGEAGDGRHGGRSGAANCEPILSSWISRCRKSTASRPPNC